MDALHMIRVSALRNALPAKADRHAARARRRHCAAGIIHPAQPKIPRPVTPVSFELLGRQRRQHFTPCDIERGAGFLECRGRAASMPLRLLGAACAATWIYRRAGFLGIKRRDEAAYRALDLD
jgi:hypothetical protein